MLKNKVQAVFITTILALVLVLIALPVGAFNVLIGCYQNALSLSFKPPTSDRGFALRDNVFRVSRNGIQRTRGIIEENHWKDPNNDEILCWTDLAVDENATPLPMLYQKARDAEGNIDLTLWNFLFFEGEVDILGKERKWCKLPKLTKKVAFSIHGDNVYSGGWWAKDLPAPLFATETFVETGQSTMESALPVQKMIVMSWWLGVCGHESGE